MKKLLISAMVTLTLMTPTNIFAAPIDSVASLAAAENSGSAWVAKFPGSTSVDDLNDPFKSDVKRFIAALHEAGISTSVKSTYRPLERAYLMHWSWMIANKKASPKDAPAKAGVNIKWVHDNDDANYSKSIAGARAMVNGYGISELKVAPALNSNHTARNAIDLATSWSKSSVVIKDANGKKVTINSGEKNSTNATLISVAKTYGLVHFTPVNNDKNHFSPNGR
ncbi:hypothetical protein SAMN04487970_1001312 [Paenibacillus tianmuensis]|uniref:Peptidoglycan-binding domain-containing protein n=1 Tax=Paenibacillus tianmuensis TaxID=624147 RepID=A0A1G4P9N9_9BACL|nr:hypothetical protein [Paenibacillus tianmuensis]SCW28984.1 hypothetical protein SAMN04487970_1001312 [Paenibacillus tianmuensis]